MAFAHARKNGAQTKHPDEATASLANDLLGLLENDRADFTSSLRGLAAIARGGDRLASFDGTDAENWLTRWLAQQPDADAMDRINPAYIPRNHLVEESLQAATAGNLAPFHALLEALMRPFDERTGLERYAERAPLDFGSYTTFCGT